jgi:hypothetical protein
MGKLVANLKKTLVFTEASTRTASYFLLFQERGMSWKMKLP